MVKIRNSVSWFLKQKSVISSPVIQLCLKQTYTNTTIQCTSDINDQILEYSVLIVNALLRMPCWKEEKGSITSGRIVDWWVSLIHDHCDHWIEVDQISSFCFRILSILSSMHTCVRGTSWMNSCIIQNSIEIFRISSFN